MTTSYTEAHLTGTLVGTIWMPTRECQKRIDIDLNRERSRYSERAGSLRHIIVGVVADGDFQSCALTGDSVITLKRIRIDGGRKTIKVRTIPLKQFKSVRDCIALRRNTWSHT